MNKDKQTAIDFLIEKLIDHQIIKKNGAFTSPIIKKAKSIEKKQKRGDFKEGYIEAIRKYKL